jgi:hypothetical protein
MLLRVPCFLAFVSILYDKVVNSKWGLNSKCKWNIKFGYIMVLGCPSTWRMNYEAYQTSFSAYKSSTCEPLISTEMDG